MSDDKNLVEKAWESVKETAESVKEAILGETDDQRHARNDAMDPVNVVVKGGEMSQSAESDAMPFRDAGENQEEIGNENPDMGQNKATGTYQGVSYTGMESYKKLGNEANEYGDKPSGKMSFPLTPY